MVLTVAPAAVNADGATFVTALTTAGFAFESETGRVPATTFRARYAYEDYDEDDNHDEHRAEDGRHHCGGTLRRPGGTTFGGGTGSSLPLRCGRLGLGAGRCRRRAGTLRGGLTLLPGRAPLGQALTRTFGSGNVRAVCRRRLAVRSTIKSGFALSGW